MRDLVACSAVPQLNAPLRVPCLNWREEDVFECKVMRTVIAI